MVKSEPNLTAWQLEAKESAHADKIGMYLTHNGVVRGTAKHMVRNDVPIPQDAPTKDARVVAVDFSYDHEGLERVLKEALSWEGIYYVRAWLNEGRVPVGESLMYVLIGADIRPHAVAALEKLLDHIKQNLVQETEIFAI